LRSQVSAKAARALVEGFPAGVGGGFCPICGEPLSPANGSAQADALAELSRRGQTEARQARDGQIRALILVALALMGRNEQP
jgi:hypothetical protein